MEPIIQIENIGYSSKDNQILSGINFQLLSKQFVTITGPSGGGKSTLLKIAASLLTATEGQMKFKGKESKEYDPILYRREVSYAFQQPVLFDQTVYDNLSFPFELRKEEVDQNRIKNLLERVKLTADFLDKPITELSGGEKQRVALLRNIMFRPSVLLLDEVTVGLDSESKEIVNKLIADVHEEGTSIMRVTHDQEELMKAETVLHLSGGKISE